MEAWDTSLLCKGPPHGSLIWRDAVRFGSLAPGWVCTHENNCRTEELKNSGWVQLPCNPLASSNAL